MYGPEVQHSPSYWTGCMDWEPGTSLTSACCSYSFSNKVTPCQWQLHAVPLFLFKRRAELSLEEVLKCLKACDSTAISFVPPVRPNGGDIY